MKILDVQGVSKMFRVQGSHRRSFLRGLTSAPQYFRKKKEIWALKDVTFSLEEGECLGIVGLNGSGKSTLLRIIEGVYRPTQGTVQRRSETSLLQLGLGFNPELTVAENVFLHGAIMGVKRKKLERSFNDIIAFAELEDYVNLKLRVLSSGMFQRLAFSTTMRADSGILLLDEVFSVGDERFVRKCKAVMDDLKAEGRTIILSSHSRQLVSEFCEKALVLDKGRQVCFGSTEEAMSAYDELAKKPG